MNIHGRALGDCNKPRTPKQRREHEQHRRRAERILAKRLRAQQKMGKAYGHDQH